MLSECVFHLRYIPIDPSAHTHSIEETGPCGGLLSPHAYKPHANTTLKIQNFLVSGPFANIFHHVKLTHEHKWQFLYFFATIRNCHWKNILRKERSAFQIRILICRSLEMNFRKFFVKYILEIVPYDGVWVKIIVPNAFRWPKWLEIFQVVKFYLICDLIRCVPKDWNFIEPFSTKFLNI